MGGGERSGQMNTEIKGSWTLSVDSLRQAPDALRGNPRTRWVVVERVPVVRNEVTADCLTVCIMRKNPTAAKAAMWGKQVLAVPRSQSMSYSICEHSRSGWKEGRAW